MMLGLLGFAPGSCLFRTGAYALRLETVALCCPAHARRHLVRPRGARLVPYEPDAQRLALMRLGGYALSGLAFALVLARPRGAVGALQRKLAGGRRPGAEPLCHFAPQPIAIRPSSTWPSAPSSPAAAVPTTSWPTGCTRSKSPCDNCSVIPITSPWPFRDPRPHPQHGTGLAVALVQQELG